MTTPVERLITLTKELGLPLKSIEAVASLLDEGNTIPFIARYRKEATGNLDEVQIRTIQERLAYLKEMDERRATILQSIQEQGKLTPELQAKIEACDSKSALEDLYLPYKPKRRTRAMIAREKGLEPLADLMWAQDASCTPEQAALAYVTEEVEDAAAALAGARDIVAERISEDAEIRGAVRELYLETGLVRSKVLTSKASEKTKFEQYYDFSEAVATIPSHRYLAIRRGEREEVLDFSLEVSEEDCNALIQRRVAWKAQGPWAAQLMQAIEDSAKRLLCPSVETDVRVELKLRADRSAVDIFADNLRNLLMAAPLGEFSVFGVDPGLRTGCKLAVVDSTGKFLENATLYVTASDRERQRAQAEFLALLDRHRPFAIAVGNGTGNREAEAFVRESLKLVGNPNVIVIQVNEAGASVYSASDVARDEFPDLDLTVRGAISIARRLQDPLAELVKIDPKSIGVGQYQHDVYQPMLQEKLHDVVESCVNAVGVELNTASASLLSYVAGIGMSLAKKVVAYRDAHGAFQTRDAVLKVPGLGPKTFEQAAGFLRIRRSKHPLDASAVHPERYALVEEMAQDAGIAVKDLIGNGKAIQMLDLKKYESASVGAFTLKDIVSELKKPGRDPRASFEPPKFREDVTTIQDLKPGMELEGVVTNVTAFGAFVDIGVHQDGLVHISELSDTFIKDPADAVSAGDKLKVRVLEVDAARKRISLSAKTGRETVKRPGAVNKRPAKEQFLSSPFAGL